MYEYRYHENSKISHESHGLKFTSIVYLVCIRISSISLTTFHCLRISSHKTRSPKAMKTLSFLFILAGCVTIGQGRLIHNDGDEVPSPSVARVLGSGLNPTLPPFEPPGFKPTTTPTDRTKRPTGPPTKLPTRPLPPTPTRRPTAPYRCGLCRETESPQFPQELILFKGQEETCAYVHSLGDLTNTVAARNCEYYRNAGQEVCGCRVNATPTLNNCTLCEDGRGLPFPNRVVLGGIRCRTVQKTAREDTRSNCVKYQGGIGSYCGCPNPIASKKVCRLCGVGKRLPVPKRVVNGITCLQHEYSATFASSCPATKAKVAAVCCATA